MPRYANSHYLSPRGKTSCYCLSAATTRAPKTAGDCHSSTAPCSPDCYFGTAQLSGDFYSSTGQIVRGLLFKHCRFVWGLLFKYCTIVRDCYSITAQLSGDCYSITARLSRGLPFQGLCGCPGDCDSRSVQVCRRWSFKYCPGDCKRGVHIICLGVCDQRTAHNCPGVRKQRLHTCPGGCNQ
jgi:hypothetical protein